MNPRVFYDLGGGGRTIWEAVKIELVKEVKKFERSIWEAVKIELVKEVKKFENNYER